MNTANDGETPDSIAALKLRMSEQIARETDPARLLSLACEAIGRFLGVARVAYGDINGTQDWISVPVDWTDGVPSMTGRRRFDTASPFGRIYCKGHTLIVQDIDQAQLSEDQIAELRRLSVHACVGVPVVENGQLVAVFNATHNAPRRWTEDEVALVAQTGGRLWSALQHLRMLDQLRESEEQFRTLADNMPALCWLAGPKGRVYWGNRQWQRFFAGVGEFSHDFTRVVHPGDVARLEEAWIAALAGGTMLEMTLRVRGSTSPYQPFLANVSPIRGHDGAVIRWCGVLVDLSIQQAHDARQAFLRTFADVTRDLTGATDILAALGDMMIDQMGVGQVIYAEVAGSDPAVFNLFTARPGRRFSEQPKMFRFAEGWDALAARYRRGETFVVEDWDQPLPELTPAVVATRRAGDMRAGISVPLVKEGRLVAVLSAIDPVARRWTKDEIALVEEVAERVWAVVSRARAEAELRIRERNQAFLIAWNDVVRHESSPHAILDATLDRLGRHFGVSRANYAEASADGAALHVLQEWRDGTSAVVGRRFPLESLGERILADYQSGAAVRVDDVDTDPRFDDTNRPMYRGIGVAAFMSVPLVSDTAIEAVLSIQQATPRCWTDVEERLLRELADRVWSVLERAMSEQRLAESEAQLAAFMENAPVAMHLKDRDGRYLRINPEFARALGRPREELQGRTDAELFPPPFARQIGAIEREARSGRVASAELESGGDQQYASSLAIAFPIARSGGVAQTGGFTLDLSDRKRAEAALARSREALYQSEKLSALGSLLAGVSHELNNPLSIVVAQAVMMERLTRDGDLAERAQKIRRAADRCARIVQTFLAMARQKQPERAAVDINAVTAAAHELADYGLRTDGVVTTRDFAASLPMIAADSDQLHQIIINLLVNAQQALATAPAGERRLTLRTYVGADGTVVLDVADNGPGVPEDQRRRIFEPFFTTKPQGEGTGIGLSFSQGLAEAHGGRLELVPSAEGACFRLTLPVDEHRVLAPIPIDTKVSGPAVPRRALVVDDEREIAESLADFLGVEGFACDIAIGGQDAQSRLAHADYDLIVSDMRMPGVDGPQLHAWIAAERPELLHRLAFATGDTLGAAAERFLGTVDCPVLEKPFMPDAVRQFLARMDF